MGTPAERGQLNAVGQGAVHNSTEGVPVPNPSAPSSTRAQLFDVFRRSRSAPMFPSTDGVAARIDSFARTTTLSRRTGLKGAAVVGTLFLADPPSCLNTEYEDPTPRKPIDLDVLPDKLPDKVRDVAQYAAVRLEIDFGVKDKLSIGSGFKIDLGDGQTYIITAGHGYRLPDGSQMPLATCFEEGYGTVVRGRGKGKPAVKSAIDQYKSRFSKQDKSEPDIALLHAEENLKSIPALKVRETPIQPNEALYIITFEVAYVDVDGVRTKVYRNPHSDDERLNQPAIYGCVSLASHITEGDKAVVTGLKNYGTGIPQEASRATSSGGMIVDKNGEVVAIITTTVSVDDDGVIHPKSPYFINKDYNVTVASKNDLEQEELSVSLIQPLTPQLIRAVKEGLDSKPDRCVLPT